MASAPREVWGDLATTAFVEASHLFKSLDGEARCDLLRIAQTVSFSPGEVISREADERFYLLRDGTAQVVAAGAQGPIVIARLERGALFGEAHVLGAGRATSVVAASDVTVVAFPAAVIAAIAGRFPKVRKLLEAVQSAREKGTG